MAAEIGDETWQKFLNQHNSLVSRLDSHASLLVEMRKFCLENSATLDLVQNRLNTTEKLIATFKLSAESLTDITKREDPATKEDAQAPERDIPPVPLRPNQMPETQKSAEPVADPSGFFTIDTNPTPIEQLYKEKPTIAVKAKDTPKRKATEDERPPTADTATEHEPKRKKFKKNHEREVRQIPPPPPVAVEEKAEEQPDEDDDSFVKSVEARTRAKEEKRKAKADKKRKRESGEPAESIKGPKNKKQKERHTANLAAAEASATAPAAETALPPSANKTKQKQNDKRPFVLAHSAGEDDENDQDYGKNSRKRQKRKGKPSKG